ncbi:MAG: hypothetical protein J0H56_00650 [Micrococcales bacterium]|nr:hypothetical protein [Micrococcales bacterium]
MPRPAATFAAGLAVVLLLAGCVPPDPIITPEPGPGATPVFASDEEALAAATDAFAVYLKVSDQILAEGGVNPERLLAVATKEWFDAQSTGFEEARAKKLHSVGKTAFDKVSLQQYDSSAIDGVGIVRVYLCVDLTGLDVVDANGHSVVTDTRPDRSPFEVTFDLASEPASDELLVANEEPWGGRDFCV